MFIALSILTIACIGALTFLRGPRDGLWWGWIAAMLFVPSWLTFKLGGLILDVRTVAAVAGLACLGLFGRKGIVHRWLPADFIVAWLFAVQIGSEYQTGRFGLLSAAEVARTWLLPYLVGRWFLGSERDITGVLSCFARAIPLLTIYSLVEAVTHVNAVNDVLGKVYWLLEEGAGYRWGLKRSQAFFDHPIYYGFLLVLILPWSLVARRQALRNEAPGWWKYLPILVGVSLCCAASRGPLIAGIITAGIPALLARRRLWVPVAVLTAVGVGGMVVFQGAVVDGLSNIAGENTEEPVMLMIGDEEVEYTGTSHRILLFHVYDKALTKLEPLGYGSQLQDVDMDDVPDRFRSIDCHYVLFLLQRGPIGLGLFVVLALVSLGTLGRLALKTGTPSSVLAGGLFGSMAMVTVMTVSVWFAPDFGSVWLFGAGLAGNLRTLKIAAEQAMPIFGPWNLESVRPAPGHAPIRCNVEPEGCQ